jgi:ABC-type multidrug transport system fused ATPase/permease subunit
VGAVTAASPAMSTRRERLATIGSALGPYARPHRRRLVTALVASVVVTAAELALPWPLTWIAELAVPSAPGSGTPGWLPSSGNPLQWPVLALLVVGVLFGLGEYVQRLAVARYVVRTVNDARVGIVSTSLRSQPDKRKPDTGDVFTRVVHDTARLRIGMKGVVVHLLQHGLFLLGVSAVLLVLDVWLGLAYLGGLTVAVGAAVVGTDRTAALARRRLRRESRAVAEALRTATDPDETRTAKDPARARTLAPITQVKGRTSWVVQGILAVTACLVLTLAVRFAEAGRLDVGDTTLVSSYLLMLHYPMMRMGRQITRLGPQLTSAERLARLADPAPTRPVTQ